MDEWFDNNFEQSLKVFRFTTIKIDDTIGFAFHS